MKKALQLFSVRDDMEKDVFETFKKVKEIGYDGVELAGLYGHSAEEITEYARQTGLEIISAHEGISGLENDDVLKMYSEIGVKYVVIPATPFDVNVNLPSISAAAERIKKIGESCKKHGLQLLFHNHFCEFDKIDGKAAIDYLFESVDKELLGAQLDTAWVNQVGLNPVDMMEKYSDRNPIVHIKDCIGKKTRSCPFGYKDVPENEIPEFSFMPIGQGMVNIGDIIEKCRERNMDWVIVEQDGATKGKTQMQCAEESANYLAERFKI